MHAGGQRRIDILPLTADAKPSVWINDAFTKEEAHFSPDGRWMAYQSNEAREMDVYVGAFPRPGQKSRISTNGGTPQPLFQTPITNVTLGLDQYDVTGDGQRFLILTPTSTALPTPITVVLNWAAGLERP